MGKENRCHACELSERNAELQAEVERLRAISGDGCKPCLAALGEERYHLEAEVERLQTLGDGTVVASAMKENRILRDENERLRALCRRIHAQLLVQESMDIDDWRELARVAAGRGEG